MGSSITNPITFAGSSTYSSSFQQVLQRAVGIASLPLQHMQNDVAVFQSQVSDLSSLQATFGSLQNSLQDIGSVANGAVTATSSNTSIATASATSGTLPGTYSVEVDDVGSSSTAVSDAGVPAVTDPTTENISSSLTYTLTVNDTPHTITLSGNSMQSLATAINDAGAGVQATIVNLGSNSSPDYRLSVTSNNLGPDTIQLNDGSTDLLSTPSPGTLAQYKVNGSSTQLTSNSDQVTLAPGLTATLVSNAPDQTVSITVSSSNAALANALSNFAAAYNSAVSTLTNERGQNGGALSGQSIVFTLSDALRSISQYVSGSGAAQSLSDIGLNFDSTGQLSFDSSKFASASSASIQQFLGGINTGGFLQAANDSLSSVADPTSGILASEITSIGKEITNENGQIADEESRVNDLQNSLQAQLAQADAAIAVLQQQKTFFTDLFAAQYLNNNVNSTSGNGG